MSDDNYTGLTVESRPSGGGDFVDFGVTVDGAFVGLQRVKATWLDNEIVLAKEAAKSEPAPAEPAPTTQ